MTITGPDVSNHQGAVNMAQVAAAGNSFVVAKATEGVGFIDAQFSANRAKAHAAGLIFGAYHFARAGDPIAEAAYFCGVVGSLQPNEFVVLDWETAYSGDHVAWCRTWLDAVAGKLGARPLIYLNASTMNAHNWAPVAATTGLWLAKYDGSTAAYGTTSWATEAMKQYSDKGSVLGVSGACDVNVFYGTADQLRAYGTAQGADMPLTNADIGLLLNYPAYSGGPSVSQVLKDLHVWARGDLGRPTDSLSFIAQLIQGVQATLAGGTAVDVQAVADAILAKLSTPQAEQVAALVLAGLNGAKLSVGPAT